MDMLNRRLIESMFAKFDKDNSGSITHEEIRDGFLVFDSDGNGTVSRDEWAFIFQEEFKGTKEQAFKMFRKLDKDGSGGVSLEELLHLFKAMDTDGNGIITKDEFYQVLSELLD